MEFQVFLTPKAEQDLKLIGHYLAEIDEKLARRFCNELFDRAESLRFFPWRGHALHGKPDIRKLIHGHYLIFYKVVETTRTVEILRFWHSAQDQGRLRMKEEPAATHAATPAAT